MELKLHSSYINILNISHFSFPVSFIPFPGHTADPLAGKDSAPVGIDQEPSEILQIAGHNVLPDTDRLDMDLAFHPLDGNCYDALRPFPVHGPLKVFLHEVGFETEKGCVAGSAQIQLGHIVHDLAQIDGIYMLPHKEAAQMVHDGTAKGDHTP